jgi:hypothetical protein
MEPNLKRIFGNKDKHGNEGGLWMAFMKMAVREEDSRAI